MVIYQQVRKNKTKKIIGGNKMKAIKEMVTEQEMDKKLEILEKILKEVNDKTAKMQTNISNKETEERIKELYKLLKKAMNNKIFMVIKKIDEMK